MIVWRASGLGELMVTVKQNLLCRVKVDAYDW